METPRHLLTPALRQVALALATARDAGADHAGLVQLLSSRSTSGVPDDLIEDILLAAGQLLAGVDPDLPMLVSVWGRYQPELIAVQIAITLEFVI
ncbi:hypothetical protein IEZ26_15845 [Nocardioides cavernae]|uniref:Uncharacterized protein n=1 Tax=Nocardioides cavernae TaxID=1921566 RepID=A0ABR8ND85_9ACTN|nr:hypothetical protein [Nocardioides cavernae]MBD3926097.1 hypothetical protein [Nocardioides cavernae]MBM7513686.1 hypothetical protein [Nocardioides cavernae]